MLRLCISSQTPPIQPIGGRSPPRRIPWKLGRDYIPNVGGVVPMMRSLLRTGLGHWIAPNPRWVVQQGPDLPNEFAIDEGYTVETVPLETEVRDRYNSFKEAVWRSFHGPRGLEPFPPEEYQAFVEYNHRTAQHLLHHMNDYDLFYVNDFQQILVGGLIGSASPALLRWHIPLEFRGYPEPVRRFFLRSMEGFDAIVVSTRAGLEELIRHGFHGRAFQVYPYIDPNEHRPASDRSIAEFRERSGLGHAPYVLCVGRMDPVKRHDLVIAAFAQLQDRFPDHRLVLVGGESFSSRQASKRNEPSKSDAWVQRLREQIRALKLDKSVILTGNVSNEDLRAAYEGASLFVHPAPWEGFGLVVIEAWMHRLPVVVSQGAGVAELVNDDFNGYAVRPGSVRALVSSMATLLSQPERARRMGEAGYHTARICHVKRAAPRLREIFVRAVESYERAGSGRGSRGGRW
jgi:glycosyltransferase involved in cell wall biosynthesis